MMTVPNTLVPATIRYLTLAHEERVYLTAQ